jgi:hypothetical protein
MKSLVLSAALCAALVTVAPGNLQAQNPTPTERPAKPPGKKQGRPDGPRESMAGLDREEARRLATARDKAKDDPTVRSLKEARDAVDKQLESAMNAAIVAADPGLAPTLEKVKQSRDRARGMRDRFESLTPEQREQLKAARQAAQDDPEVMGAREKMRAADSPEARREAGRAMQEAMKAAAIKKNPDLAPLLEQLGPPPGEPRGPRGPQGPAPQMPDGNE